MLFLNNWKGETMSKARRVVDTKAKRVVDTKAQIVVDTYNETQAENASSQACYDAALKAAEYQGGIEIWNSNNGRTSGISSAPNRIFEFDDGSSVSVTYGGARILTEEDLNDES